LKFPDFQFDLLGQPLSQFAREKNEIIFTLAPGACHCLAPTQKPAGLSGENYRRARALAAFAIQALGKILPPKPLTASTGDGSRNKLNRRRKTSSPPPANSPRAN
jgi:hypothetical protein